MVEIIINRTPYPSPRPRSRWTGQFVQIYMPTAYVNEKEIIKNQLLNSLGNNFEMLVGPLKLDIIFYMKIPNSKSKKEKIMMNGRYHICKPDIDNLLKTYKDAFEGVLYKNDSYISEYGNVKKIWSDKPRIELKISEIKEGMI